MLGRLESRSGIARCMGYLRWLAGELQDCLLPGGTEGRINACMYVCTAVLFLSLGALLMGIMTHACPASSQYCYLGCCKY